MKQYKIVFGVFDRPKAYDGNDAKRTFAEVFESELYSRNEMIEKMKPYFSGFQERHLDLWLSTPEKPMTFVDGEIHGWRLYEVTVPVDVNDLVM